MNSLIAKYCLSLGVMVLLATSSGSAQLRPERLQCATTELEKLAEKEMQATGVPGIAIAVVFNESQNRDAEHPQAKSHLRFAPQLACVSSKIRQIFFDLLKRSDLKFRA
jgi:hypothetical protein